MAYAGIMTLSFHRDFRATTRIWAFKPGHICLSFYSARGSVPRQVKDPCDNIFNKIYRKLGKWGTVGTIAAVFTVLVLIICLAVYCPSRAPLTPHLALCSPDF